MNVGILGIIATLLLISSSIPQVWMCYRNGHANGISAGMLWLWFSGMLLMGIYVTMTRGGDLVLFSNYGINICMILIILKFKYFPEQPGNFVLYKRLKKMFNS